MLVTGAGGFVGRPAVDALLAKGFEVHTVGRRELSGLPAGVTAHRAALLAHDGAAQVLVKVRPTHLLHLAWDVTPGRYWQSPGTLDWVSATLRLYRAFAACGGQRLVGVGTCAEYDWNTDILDEASTPLRPNSLYGVCKDALRRILTAATRQDGISMAWARLFFMYGPGEAQNRLVSDVARALLQGEPALCGDGRAERDFMHVGDVAAALVAILDSTQEDAVNVASGVCVPVRSIVQTLAKFARREDLVRLGARATPANEPPRLAASVSALRDKIGFTPRFTLDSGLADTLEWWRTRL